jgi:hypothetical protein
MARQLQRWARPLAADRALVHRAARRLGHPASIPRAIMSRSPEALALGPAVISFRRRYHCPSAGAFLTGLATAVGPASRRFQRRRYADALTAASFSSLRFASARFHHSPFGERNWKLDPTWARPVLDPARLLPPF